MIFTLIEKRPEVSNVKTFIFKPEHKLSWIAGQYFIYSLSHEKPDLRGKQRFFTTSSSPFEKNPHITTRVFKNSSSFKKALDKLKIGGTISVKGPDGDFIIDSKNKKYVFIAGGIGITPFVSIIKQLDFENKSLNITLLYSNATKDFVFKKELEKILLKHKEFKIEFFINKRIDKRVLKKFVDNKTIFYISGPDPMVDAMEKNLIELGIPKEDIREDYFSGYKVI